jgi:hypothetical protein
MKTTSSIARSLVRFYDRVENALTAAFARVEARSDRRRHELAAIRSAAYAAESDRLRKA